MDVEWSSDQVRLALKAVIVRLQNNPVAFTIETGKDNSAKFSNFSGKSVYIVIDGNRIYLSLDNHAGSYEVRSWWWQDLEIKELKRELLNFARTGGKTSGDVLVQCFPEIVTEEFERQFLGVKDGKTES